MDVAQLGVEVRSNGVEKTTGDLNKLSGAAARAEAATEGLSSANRGATGAASAAAKAYATEGAAASSASKQIEMMSRAANLNVKRMGGSMSGLAAQFQDIGVTAAGGMNPMLIALQQGTQIAGQMEMAMQSGAKATTVFATAFKSLLSPISIASIVLTALAAAALQMVNWAKLGASAVRGLAEVLEMIAPYAVTAAAGLALLYAPTIIFGIMNVIALLGRMAVAAVSAGIAIAAANPLGAFVLGVTAAVAAMNIFREEITKIFGRDIVGDVKDAANFIINSFEAAFEDLKFIWATFPDVIKAAVIGAANAALSAVEGLIQKAAALMDSFHAQVNKILPEGIQIPEIGKVSLGSYKLDDGGAADRASKALDGRNANIERIMGQDRVGQFGEGIARGASAASGKLQELAKWMTTVDEKKKKKGAKTDVEKYNDIVNGAERRIASLDAEAAALGMTEEAAAAYRYETDLLNEAQQKGLTLTDLQKGELSALASVMASVEAATKKTREAIAFAKDTTRGFVDDFVSGLKRGESVWKSFGDAALGVLDKIANKLLDSAFDGLFGGGGGLSGLIGSIFGGGGGFQANTTLGSFLTNGYAEGTMAARTGLALVGERGPEIVRFGGGEKVIPNHQLRGVNDNGRGGGDAGVQIHYAPVYNVAQGADPKAIAELRQAQARDRADFTSRVVASINEARKRNAKI
ncbi:phage tail length tape measure family protein [Shinella sp.]|uniref:phage tail length tape measure family protein n=1 Tax=Shinella sp. TaxID=1870904 RepID=UPI0028A83EAB|nr:phage tail length tape measure family protein [Shinella sp.]